MDETGSILWTVCLSWKPTFPFSITADAFARIFCLPTTDPARPISMRRLLYLLRLIISGAGAGTGMTAGAGIEGAAGRLASRLALT